MGLVYFPTTSRSALSGWGIVHHCTLKERFSHYDLVLFLKEYIHPRPAMGNPLDYKGLHIYMEKDGTCESIHMLFHGPT